jgi:hypothetical protein
MTDTYTHADVMTVLNRAADDVLDAAEAEDQGLRDAVNLVVNVAGSYLSGEASTVEEAVTINYDDDLPTILGWIAQGIR